MRKLSALLVSFCCASAAWAEAPQQQLNTTLEHLAQSKETEAQLKKRLADSEHELGAIRERAAGIGERLQASEQRVTTEENALEKVNSDVTKKREEFEARKNDYGRTVLSLLRMRSLPPTAMFAAGDDAQKMLLTASVLEKTNEAVAQKAARLRSDLSTLKKLHGEAKQRDASTRAEKEQLRIEQVKLERELVARQQLQAKLNADHERATEEVAKFSRESQSLQELIGKLEESEKAQAKLAAAPKKPDKLREFNGAKGSARAPVTGAILHRYGDAQGANGTYRGTVFKARAGAAVVAPFDGQVVFTGPFRDYGNMVLIKHKNGYISLIAGLGKVSAGLNQPAMRGEPIGTMPEDGRAEAYVELRDANAKPIDPADWFANVVGKSAP